MKLQTYSNGLYSQNGLLFNKIDEVVRFFLKFLILFKIIKQFVVDNIRWKLPKIERAV
ncbi:unnamed protein product [Meloidogyne enterolobii]|uniref:Uncharacterized protein n=1 Tax=Meloidogyne enterolobii TaxID=390850 RepID=A0ACB0ZML9_MELEN